MAELFDHMDELGKSLGEIAVEKAAIIKSSTKKVVLAAPDQEYSPTLPGSWVAAASMTTEKPRPKPRPAKWDPAHCPVPTEAMSPR